MLEPVCERCGVARRAPPRERRAATATRAARARRRVLSRCWDEVDAARTTSRVVGVGAGSPGAATSSASRRRHDVRRVPGSRPLRARRAPRLRLGASRRGRTAGDDLAAPAAADADGRPRRRDPPRRAPGRIVAERDVRLDDWFFQCHFPGDPVQPGCLGVDAVWQLLGFFCVWARGARLGPRARLRRDRVLRPDPPPRSARALRDRRAALLGAEGVGLGDRDRRRPRARRRRADLRDQGARSRASSGASPTATTRTRARTRAAGGSRRERDEGRARDRRRHRHRRGLLPRASPPTGFRVAVHYRSSEAPEAASSPPSSPDAFARARRPRACPSEVDALVAELTGARRAARRARQQRGPERERA